MDLLGLGGVGREPGGGGSGGEPPGGREREVAAGELVGETVEVCTF
jgi:hypothetical protein